jgi:predicted RNA polymerase sigma factor
LLLHQPDEPREAGLVRDDQLRLIFTCCHPALAPVAQTALTLRLLGGLEVPEIARAYLVPEATIAQRIVRATKKMRDAAIPYRVPEAGELPDRLPPVLTVLYLIFNEGYAATSGPLLRIDLCLEAIRLARALADLMPDEPEVLGLLALLLLTEARRPARLGPSGELVRLADQDRAAPGRDGRAVGRGRRPVHAGLVPGAPRGAGVAVSPSAHCAPVELDGRRVHPLQIEGDGELVTARYASVGGSKWSLSRRRPAQSWPLHRRRIRGRR